MSNGIGSFIGRGEILTRQLLTNPFGIKVIQPQVPIDWLISKDELEFFGKEVRQHKFDFVLYRENDTIAIEVNYKHGEKADRKSNDIFAPTLKKNGIALVTIDDFDCRSLFKSNSDGEHKITTDDLRDILDAFDKAEVKLD